METGKIKVTIEARHDSDTYEVKLNIGNSIPSLVSAPTGFAQAQDIANNYKLALGILESYIIDINYPDGTGDYRTIKIESFDAAFKYASELIKGYSVISVNVRKVSESTKEALMSSKPNEFGDMLREFRKSRRIQLEDMADQLKVSPSYLSDIELGRCRPSFEILETLECCKRVMREDEAELIALKLSAAALSKKQNV